MAKKPKQKNALPSESEILSFIAEQPGHVGKREIARAFQIKGAARIPLKRMLRQMADKGLIDKRKRRVAKPGTLPPVEVLRVMEVTEDGEVLCTPDSERDRAPGIVPPIRLLEQKTPKANITPVGVGARFLARLTRVKAFQDTPEHYQARIIRVLDSRDRNVLGVLRYMQDGSARIEPISKRAKRDIIIGRTALDDVSEGELVEVEIGSGTRDARIAERHGKVEGPHAASLIAIAEHDIPLEFSGTVLKEAKAAKPPKLEQREDLRSVAFVTIDPADARDRDDAVWACPDDDPKNKGGYKVIVAIADVAHFVTAGSALDREARKRGNSVYFPDRVVPMLPETLSNGLCSLNPNEDRAAMAVEMVFNAQGAKIRHRFTEALIKTQAALSYGQAQAAIDGSPDDLSAVLLTPVLEPLWAAYRVLGRARKKRAPLELELPERRVRLGEDGHIEDIYVPDRFDAHKLIEEFMIQANVAAAETLEKARLPLIYRVHEAPPEEKVKTLGEFLKSLDIKLDTSQIRAPETMNKILNRVRGQEIEPLVHEVVLRAQSQAFYGTENLGHFGLNLSHYAHFTSPIRRYADLSIHRALKSKLRGDRIWTQQTAADPLEQIAEQISKTERRAMAAERDTIDRLCAAYLSEKVGSRFKARISGMTRGALFVELADIGADGIVPAKTLAQDYFRYDEKQQRMTGENTGETYRLGDKVEVELVEAVPVSGGLRFKLLTAGTLGKSAPKPGRAKSRRKQKHRKR